MKNIMQRYYMCDNVQRQTVLANMQNKGQYINLLAPEFGI